MRHLLLTLVGAALIMSSSSAQQIQPGDRPAGIQTASVTTPDPDAAFMAEVDASVSRRSLGELRTIDEFTPRAPLPEGRQ